MNFKRIDTTANRLKEALKVRGKRQIDVIKATGIDKGALSHYLKGTYEPKQDTIYKIAKFLNVSEMWLWGYDVPMERTPEQKNNDILTDVVIKAKSDVYLMSVIEKLNTLDSEQIKTLDAMLTSFIK